VGEMMTDKNWFTLRVPKWFDESKLDC
jgi:hypothetical protein